MAIFEKFKKERLVFGLYLLVLIVVFELILHSFHLPGWPLFMVMIFFFESGMNTERAPNIIIGGLVGVLCYMATVQFLTFVAPYFELTAARLFFICLVVYAIVAFGEIAPKVFNNYTFMFFLISGLAGAQSTGLATALIWMGLILVGGVVVASIIGIRLLTAKSLGIATQ